MPKKNIEPELFELVTSYQVHSCLSVDVNTQTGLWFFIVILANYSITEQLLQFSCRVICLKIEINTVPEKTYT